MPVSAISAFGLGPDAVLDARLEGHAAEVRGRWRPARPARSLRAEPGLPAAGRRQARRVVGVRRRRTRRSSGPRRAPSGTGCRARRCSGRMYACGLARDAAERALHAEQPGVAGRDADRAAAVATGGQADQAAGDRGRRAARRAADGAAVAPRVVGDAVELGDADVEAAELAGRRLPDRHHAAPLEEPLRRGATCAWRRGPGRRATPRCTGQPATGSSSLIAGGHAAERQRQVGALGRRAGPARRRRSEKQFRSEASMAASVASSSSTGERSPARNASTSEDASPVHGPSLALSDMPFPSAVDRRTVSGRHQPGRHAHPAAPDELVGQLLGGHGRQHLRPSICAPIRRGRPAAAAGAGDPAHLRRQRARTAGARSARRLRPG